MGVVIVAVAPKLTISSFSITLSLVVLAAISDALDGYLARRWDVTSATGYVLDAMGDRAVHLALMLAMLVRYEFHPLIAWLLVFRDIGIYAIRILARNWLQRSRDARWISVLHALGVRTWLATYLLRDGVRLFSQRDILDTVVYSQAQTILIGASIAFSYWGLFRAMRWTIDDEHATIEAIEP
jgi:phosphatidylglycerophosphate synthase